MLTPKQCPSLPLVLPCERGNSWLTDRYRGLCAKWRPRSEGMSSAELEEGCGINGKRKRWRMIGGTGPHLWTQKWGQGEGTFAPSSSPPTPWRVIRSWFSGKDSSPQSCPATMQADGDRDRWRGAGGGHWGCDRHPGDFWHTDIDTNTCCRRSDTDEISSSLQLA